MIGLYSQASKDLSSVSMFVRITRGLHVVESAAVLSRSLPLDDVGNDPGDGRRHISNTKECKRSWSWRWDETLVLPGSMAASSRESSRSSPRSAGLRAGDKQAVDIEEEHELHGENQQGLENVANPLVAAVHISEEPHASTGGKDTKDTKEITLAAREALSTTTDVVSRACAPGDVHGNTISPRESDASSPDKYVSDVADTVNDFTERHQRAPRMSIQIDDKLAGGGSGIAEVTSPESCVGATKKKRGVSFWSLRKGNRSSAEKTDDSVLKEKSRDNGTGNHEGRKVALTAATHVAVVAADDVPNDGSSSSDFDPSRVKREQDTSQKIMASVDFTSSDESCPEVSVKVNDAMAGGGAVVGNSTPTKPDSSVVRKMGVSFWRPRKGNRSNAEKEPDASVLEEQSRDGDTGNGNGGKETLPAATVVAAAAADEIPDGGNSSNELDSIGAKREGGISMTRTSVDSTSSDESCPEISVKVSGIVAGGRGAVGNDTPTAADSGVARKRGVSFWSPRKGHRKISDAPTLAKQSSDTSSNWDSEASTVFDIDDQEEHDADGTDEFVPGGGSIVGNDSPERLRKRGGGAFWNPIRERGTGRKIKAGDSDEVKKGDGSGLDRHAPGGPGVVSTTKSHITAETTRKPKTYKKFRGRRSRAPLKAHTTPEVLFVEVWEINCPAVLKSSSTERDAVVAKLGCNGFDREMGSAHTGELEETGVTEGVSDWSDSGEKSPPAHPSENERHLAARFETGNESLPTNRDMSHASGATPRQGRDSDEAQLFPDILTAQQECADDDHAKLIDDDTVGDESSVGSTVSTKKSRPKRSGMFSSLFKGRRTKNNGWLKLRASESPLTSSEPETPRKSQLAVEEDDDNRSEAPAEEEDGQQGVEALGGKSENAISEATLVSRAPNVPEKSGINDDDDDDDASDLSQVSKAGETAVKHARKRIGGMFSSPIEDNKPNKRSLPPFGWQRSDSELLNKPPEGLGKPGEDPKPILWGRLTLPVTDVLYSARGGNADGMNDGCLLNGQNVGSGVAGFKNLANSECLPDRSSTGDNVEGSSLVFGMNLPRLGQKKKGAEKGVKTLDGTSVDVWAVETASASLPRTSPTSAVGSWFEVGNPKGKGGKKVKGRMHLTLTCADETCPPENIP